MNLSQCVQYIRLWSDREYIAKLCIKFKGLEKMYQKKNVQYKAKVNPTKFYIVQVLYYIFFLVFYCKKKERYNNTCMHIIIWLIIKI